MIGQSTSTSGITSFEIVCRGVQSFQLQYVPTDEQVVDILTKALMKGKFVFFRDKMGIVENTFLAKREC
jgi:hypothetical protein